MKRITTALITVALVTSVAAVAAGHNVIISKGEDFSKARAELIKDGWRPRKITIAAPDAPSTAFRAAGYGETESCSNTDNFCVLDYVDAKGACLRLLVNYNRLQPLQAW